MTQKILSRFRIWQRITFLLITFFISLSVLGVFSLSGIESYIDIAEKEKIGASMMRSINALFLPIAHISADNRNVAGDDKLRAEALQSIELLGDIWKKTRCISIYLLKKGRRMNYAESLKRFVQNRALIVKKTPRTFLSIH
jgi:hypothetical protein